MLLIRNQQKAAFVERRWQEFAPRMLDHLERCFPVDAQLLGTAGLTEVVQRGTARARAHELATFGEACRFIDLGMALGTDFDRDPLLPWAAEILASTALPGARMTMLDARAHQHIARVAGEDGRLAIRAALRARGRTYDERFDATLGGDEHIRAQIERVHPTRCAELTAACSWRRFFAHLDRMVMIHELHAPRARASLALLICLLGGRFTTDPQHPWAPIALAETAGQAPDARARLLFERALEQLERALTLLRRGGG